MKEHPQRARLPVFGKEKNHGKVFLFLFRTGKHHGKTKARKLTELLIQLGFIEYVKI